LSKENREWKNRLLAAVADEDWEQLEQHLTPVDLPLGQMLFDKGHAFDRVYFPEAGVISTVAPFTDSQSAEMATTGREGVCSVSAVLGADQAYSRHIVQVPGMALTMDIHAFRQAQQRLPQFARLLLSYARAFMAQVLQSVACNAVHSVEERCARWLLMCRDRSEGERFLLTQEFLAEMLGVSRASVNVVARTLQSAGLIRYSRGGITIVDPEGLEDSACECYRSVRDLYDQTLPMSFARDGLPG
jgi:CRP-like cAMP-binding protein